MDSLDDRVMDTPNPDDEESRDPDPSNDTEGRVDGDTLSADEEQSPDASTRNPDAAYKGLQRVVASKDKEIQQLRQQLETGTQSKGQIEQIKLIVGPILQDIAQSDPERARALAIQIAHSIKDAELEEYRNRDQSRSQEALYRQAEESNMAELRAIAADLGADPDSDLIDYGDSTQYLAERIRRVRESARASAKPAKPTAPKPSGAQTHNTQPGVPASSKPTSGVPTDADWLAALRAYQAKPGPATLKKMAEIREKRREAQEKVLI